MARLSDPKVNGKYPFQYTSSAATDLAATFERVRKRNKAGDQGLASSQQSTVRQLRREK